MSLKLGVVIPVYNRKDYLFEALETVFSQPLSPGSAIEVVVVDDGSTDGLADDARLPMTRPQFHFVTQANAERGAARNRGAQLAIDSLKCDWILFFDSDDALVPGSLLEITRVLGSVDAETVAIYSAIQVWQRGRLADQAIRHPAFGASGDLSRLLLDQVVLPLGATVIRSSVFEALGGFLEDRDMSGSEDFQFLFRVGLSGKILFVPVTSVLYRRHEQNTRPSRYLRSVTLAMASLRSVVFEKWHAPQGERNFARLLRLGEFCQVGALSSSGFEADAYKVLLRSVKRSPAVICDRRFLILVLSLSKTLLFRAFQLKRRTTS